MISLRYHNARLCRKATFDVAHCVGQLSVFLWFTFRKISDSISWFETPVGVGESPSVAETDNACTLTDIEMRFDAGNSGVNIFIKFLLEDCPFSSSSGLWILYLMLVIKSETYRSKYQIKKLQGKLGRRIDLDYIVRTYLYIITYKFPVVVEAKNELFEHSDLRTSCWNVIDIQSDKSVVFRNIAICKTETVFYKFVVQDGELVLYMVERKSSRFELVITEEYPDFCFVIFEKVEDEINNLDIFFESVGIDFLPLYFLLYSKIFQQITSILVDAVIISAVYKNSTVKVGIVCPFLVAFVKPNIYHASYFEMFDMQKYKIRSIITISINLK